MADREAFEGWLRGSYPDADLAWDDYSGGHYLSGATRARWVAWQAATALAERRWLDAVARIESLQQELDKARATGDAERCPTPNDGNAGSEPDFVQTLQGFASMCDSHARGEAVWHSAGIMPEVGRKVVALYCDGSGAMLLFRCDNGFIDESGDDFDADNWYDLAYIWTYLPDDFELWCEQRLQDPMTLKLPEASHE